MNEKEDYIIFAAEIAEKNGAYYTDGNMALARKNKRQGLTKRKIFAVTSKEVIIDNASVLSVRFVLAPKNENNYTEYKVRFVIGRHWNATKKLIAHSSQNLRLATFKLIMIFFATDIFDSRMGDAWQPYPQTDEHILRQILIGHVAFKFQLRSGHALRQIKI